MSKTVNTDKTTLVKDTPLQCVSTPKKEQEDHVDKTQEAHTLLDISDGEKYVSASKIEILQEPIKRLFYKVTEIPPWYLTLFFGLQQVLFVISKNLAITVLVSELVCARDDELLKTQIFSSTLMLSGLATFLVTSFGIRLPIYQGPSKAYVIPLLAMREMEDWQCPTSNELELMYVNSTVNITYVSGKIVIPREFILPKLQSLQGSLMLAGFLHMLIGVTGLVGFLLKYIGPITVVPAITLIGLSIFKMAMTFSETHWGVAFVTSVSGVIFSFYLGGRETPIPSWNRRRGFFITWYPLHQMFAILISVLIGWLLSGILTETGILSRDANSKEYYARTDSRVHVIGDSPWYYFPYPGQFGYPSFNVGAFISFFMATLMSVLDSVGDYNACARVCCVPRPPVHALNRGLALEGLMSLLAGAMGVGHATVSSGSSIGTLAITKVVSRRVFQVLGVMLVVFSILNKAGAVFITIPYSVIGGNMILTFGLFVGIVLSNLQFIDLQSSRNCAIIGLALFIGMLVPTWAKTKPKDLDTGNEEVNRIIVILLSNPVFVGGFLACFLDNTVPGTAKERGLDWGDSHEDEADDGSLNTDLFVEGKEVYEPLFIPKSIRRSRFARFIPIIPDTYTEREKNV